MRLENIIKYNIDNRCYIEIEFKNVDRIDKYKTITGVYFIFDNKNLYIGKSKDIRNRLLNHRKNIKNKSHYNIGMYKFKTNTTKCIVIESKNEDLDERYFINKFSKKLNLINIVIPSCKEKTEYIDIDKYIIRNMLKSIKRSNRVVFNRYIYNNYIKRCKDINLHSRKKYIFNYFKYLNLLGNINNFEHSKLTQAFFAEFKSINGTIMIKEKIKILDVLLKIDMKNVKTIDTEYTMFLSNS